MAELMGVIAIGVGSAFMMAVIHRDAVRRGQADSRGARWGVAFGVLGLSIGTVCGVGGALVGLLA